ncbi:DUF4845 domain-containing protein [Lysobacter humi (ex Lee et al. 2017)]
MMRNQRGMTLTSFVVVLAVVGFFIYVGMKLVPMYLEYFSVKKALESMAADTDLATSDAAFVRDRFFKRMDISYVESIKPEHVKLVRRDAGWMMTVDYEVRKPLIANLDVVGHFKAEKELKRIGD